MILSIFAADHSGCGWEGSWLSGLLWSWERGMGIVQVKYPRTHCSHPHWVFLLNKCSSDCLKYLVNFKVLKKLMLTAFCIFSLFLWQGGFLEVLAPSSMCASLN